MTGIKGKSGKYPKLKEQREKMRKAHLGKHSLTEEGRKKLSEINKGKGRIENLWWATGKEHPRGAWQGGKSFEPYSPEFNNQLKEKIRKKYNYRCQQCFRHQGELSRKLCIHHIDFDKQNNQENNLIPLCQGCHNQTMFNREDWTNYFQGRVI